jgi:DNA modification methylase
MKFALDEMETAIIMNCADKEATVVITGDKVRLRKFEQLAEKYPETYKLLSEEKDGTEVYYRKYSVPRKYIRFGKPPSEAKIALGKRLADSRTQNAV